MTDPDKIASRRTGYAFAAERAYRCESIAEGSQTVGDARYGRRDNGLVAAEYAAAGDVDPRVGEHLLELLARDGIAAYLHPSSDLYSVTRSQILPKRPTDRLFVDRAHLATARDHLARLAQEEREAEAGNGTPSGAGLASTSLGREPSAEEIDRAFAEIVAGLGPAPAVPDTRSSDPPRPTREPAEPEQERSLLDGLDTFGADLPDDESEPFVPPEPPPVPRPSLPAVLGVIGVVGGIALFLKPDLVSFLAESLAMFLGFAAVVAGFATLVWRLRPGGDDESPDPDHGARV